MHTNVRTEAACAGVGKIAKITGLKSVITEDTLCEADSPVVLCAIIFLRQWFSLLSKPKTSWIQEKLVLG
ncbi:MAG: hypothetical protein P3M75_00285 [Candidatus Hodgkinia cicadicola]|nr:MAG: hypothetical protein P3M75_00285 [Candidatus Hodgkinia cicadicola]